MKPRHKITKEYNENPRYKRRWELTLEWLRQFDIKGMFLECGDGSEMTSMLLRNFPIGISNTSYDLDYARGFRKSTDLKFDGVFAFEIIEHLLNPLIFMKDIALNTDIIYLSTPINRPKWMRNKELHFHEFNYNELMHLINKAGFKIVDEKIINPSVRWWIGFRPMLRKFFGCGNNILLRLKRK